MPHNNKKVPFLTLTNSKSSDSLDENIGVPCVPKKPFEHHANVESQLRHTATTLDERISIKVRKRLMKLMQGDSPRVESLDSPAVKKPFEKTTIHGTGIPHV